MERAARRHGRVRPLAALTLRPYGLFLDGELRWGLEADLEDGLIVSIRPHRGPPDPFLLSPAFANAHSHLEYRAMQHRFDGLAYPEWIAAITAAKLRETDDQVRQACRLAAVENRATGVAWIEEHSDRPFAAEAMVEAGLCGVIYQEVITIAEWQNPKPKLKAIRAKANLQRQLGLPVWENPHAPHTVDPDTLRGFAHAPHPISIHVAETNAERELFHDHRGPLAELFQRLGAPLPPRADSAIAYLESCGLLGPATQLVHCCDVTAEEIEMIRASGARVAHCPRSNRALGSPPAPVRALLDAGIEVGLGMDSAASSGPVDMFAEMRSARSEAARRGDTLTGEEIWRMATTAPQKLPAIKIHVDGAQTADEVIDRATPDLVEWA